MPSHKLVTELTDEQEALISEYREKWRSIQNRVDSIDRIKVTETINAAYLISGFPEPEILFYGNPLAAIQEVTRIENFKNYLGRDIHIKFSNRVFEHLQHILTRQLDYKFFIRLRNQTLYTKFPYYSTSENSQPCYFPYSVMTCLEHQLITDLEKKKPELDFSDISYFTNCISRPAQWAGWGCFFDFCISVLKLQHDKNKWQIIQHLIQNCGFLFWYENVCIACERPSKLSYDEENLLHADGEPALQFPDGYGVYAHHGRYPFNEW